MSIWLVESIDILDSGILSKLWLTGKPFSPLTCHRTGERELGSTLGGPDQSLDSAGCVLLSITVWVQSPEGRAVLPLLFGCPGVTGPWQAPWALLHSSSGPWPASLELPWSISFPWRAGSDLQQVWPQCRVEGDGFCEVSSDPDDYWWSNTR